MRIDSIVERSSHCSCPYFRSNTALIKTDRAHCAEKNVRSECELAIERLEKADA